MKRGFKPLEGFEGGFEGNFEAFSAVLRPICLCAHLTLISILRKAYCVPAEVVHIQVLATLV